MTLKPSAQGSLTKTPFPHLLVYMQGRKLTGTLAIWPEADQGSGQDRLLFQEGTLVAVRPLRPAATAFAALLAIFERREASYAFYEGQNLLGAGPEVLRDGVELYALLARGLKQFPREEVMDAALGRLGGRVLRIKPGVLLERLELEGKELSLVDMLRAAPSTLEELLAGAEVSPLAAKRVLYLLALVRGIEVVEEGSVTGTSASVLPRIVQSSQPPASAAPALNSAPPMVGASPSLPAPPALPAGLAAEDAGRWNELVALYRRLDDVNHFELLGVAMNAQPAELGAAYFALVKKFHPDRLPPALAPLAPCAQLLFERITEAHETLSHDERRFEHIKAVEGGGGTRAAERLMRNVLESAVEFQKAEVLLKRRDYPQALTLIRSALAKNPDESDYHAFYAWLLHLMNPGEGAPFDEILRSLERALTQHPRNERAHYYKGAVLKRLQRNDEALTHFRSAAEINPRNLEAMREVRLAEMRKDGKPPQGSGSSRLLSKLFGGSKGD